MFNKMTYVGVIQTESVDFGGKFISTKLTELFPENLKKVELYLM